MGLESCPWAVGTFLGTNEAGEAFTAIGPKKTTTVDGARDDGSSLRGGRSVNTVVAPVTSTGGSSEGSSQ